MLFHVECAVKITWSSHHRMMRSRFLTTTRAENAERFAEAPDTLVGVAIERFVGVDLAWADGKGRAVSNETGLVVLDSDGVVIDAGWARGLDNTLEWIASATACVDALLFVDAPLVVNNPSGQRPCERQVGQRYGRWQVSANSTNTATPRQAGVQLRKRLATDGWTYDDGLDGPPYSGRMVSECYPYTTLVGVAELGYHQDEQRPRYKRKPKKLPAAQWRAERASNCDALVRRLLGLEGFDPPLRLQSHQITRDLLKPSPQDHRLYKHREDLIDALICAWTAVLWHRHGLTRCQVLGPPSPDDKPAATIIAPATPDQRRDPWSPRPDGPVDSVAGALRWEGTAPTHSAQPADVHY